MNFSKSTLLPLALALVTGACTPFYPKPVDYPHQSSTQTPGQQVLTAEEQLLLEQSRAAQAAGQGGALTPGNVDNMLPPTGPAPTGKKNYPTASPVEGRPGFVYNPYTHGIVDVKGIAPGKLCRDPEDPDESHKFRVP